MITQSMQDLADARENANINAYLTLSRAERFAHRRSYCVNCHEPIESGLYCGACL